MNLCLCSVPRSVLITTAVSTLKKGACPRNMSAYQLWHIWLDDIATQLEIFDMPVPFHVCKYVFGLLI